MTTNWKLNLYLITKFGCLVIIFMHLPHLLLLVLGLLPQSIITIGLLCTIILSFSILVFQLKSSHSPSYLWIIAVGLLFAINHKYNIRNLVPWGVYLSLYIILITSIIVWVIKSYHSFEDCFILLDLIHYVFFLNIIGQFAYCVQDIMHSGIDTNNISLFLSYLFYIGLSFVIFDPSHTKSEKHIYWLIFVFLLNACCEHLIYGNFWYNLQLFILLLCIHIIKHSLHQKLTLWILRIIFIMIMIPFPFHVFLTLQNNYELALNILSASVSIIMAVVTILCRLPISNKLKLKNEEYSESEILHYLRQQIQQEQHFWDNDFMRISKYCKNNNLPYIDDAFDLAQKTSVTISGAWGAILAYSLLFCFLLSTLALSRLSWIRNEIKERTYQSNPAIASAIDTIEDAFYFSSFRIEHVCAGETEQLPSTREYFTQKYMQQCDTSYFEGNLKAALHKANLLITMNPEDAVYYDNRVTIYFAMGDFDKALSDIEKTLMLDPGNAIYIASKGAALVALARPYEGLEYLNKAIQVDDIGFAYRYRALGNMAIGNTDRDDILQDLLYALELDGNYNDYVALARYCLEYEHYDIAFFELQQALDMHKYYGKTFYWLGQYYELTGDNQRSVENYELAEQYGYHGNGY